MGNFIDRNVFSISQNRHLSCNYYYEMSYLWNVGLWNVFLWIVLSMKCPMNEISYLWNVFLLNFFLWNVPTQSLCVFNALVLAISPKPCSVSPQPCPVSPQVPNPVQSHPNPASVNMSPSTCVADPNISWLTLNTIHHVSNHLYSIPGPIQRLPWHRKAAVPESWIILQNGGKTWRKFLANFLEKEKSQWLQERPEKKEPP